MLKLSETFYSQKEHVMLQQILDLPIGINGVEASGVVSRDDFRRTLLPLFKNAENEKLRLRLLYRFGSDFKKFSVGAVIDDVKMGFKYLGNVERCVVVTDRKWIRKSCRVLESIIPYPLKVYDESHMQNAVKWLSSPTEPVHLNAKLIEGKEIVLVEVDGPLAKEDFDVLAAKVDPWIADHRSLQGLVIHAKRFPGWENLGGFLRHLEFVGDHHRKIKRVAFSSDGFFPEVMPMLANYFIAADIKRFTYKNVDLAISWASKGSNKKLAIGHSKTPRKHA
jgi:hypothetical protein